MSLEPVKLIVNSKHLFWGKNVTRKICVLGTYILSRDAVETWAQQLFSEKLRRMIEMKAITMAQIR